MTEVASRVVEERDYSRSAPLREADDEIGLVVDAFNRMLDEVQLRTRALEASDAALREADRRKDDFLATLAHELRNPLAPIRNAAELLRMHAIDDRHRERASEIISRQGQANGTAARRSARCLADYPAAIGAQEGKRQSRLGGVDGDRDGAAADRYKTAHATTLTSNQVGRARG